jgi:hypothetical protein
LGRTHASAKRHKCDLVAHYAHDAQASLARDSMRNL